MEPMEQEPPKGVGWPLKVPMELKLPLNCEQLQTMGERGDSLSLLMSLALGQAAESIEDSYRGL
jgi:hypothetical protein